MKLDYTNSRIYISSSGYLYADAGRVGVAGATLFVDQDIECSGFATKNLSGTNILYTSSGNVFVDTDFKVNTNKFTIAGATGNTAIAGTLDIQGAISSSVGHVIIGDTLDLQGNVYNTTGSINLVDNVVITGTLDIQNNISNSTGNVVVNDTFYVQGTLNATGATSLSSTLAVTGATTLTGTLNANGGGKLGNASTDLVAMYDATAIARQSHIADATGSGDVVARVNDILTAIENFGIVKTS